MKFSFLARDRERTVPIYILRAYAKMIVIKSYTKIKLTRAWSRAKNETFTVIRLIIVLIKEASTDIEYF